MAFARRGRRRLVAGTLQGGAGRRGHHGRFPQAFAVVDGVEVAPHRGRGRLHLPRIGHRDPLHLSRRGPAVGDQVGEAGIGRGEQRDDGDAADQHPMLAQGRAHLVAGRSLRGQFAQVFAGGALGEQRGDVRPGRPTGCQLPGLRHARREHAAQITSRCLTAGPPIRCQHDTTGDGHVL
ncbi:hypothetical protein C5B73_05520 [Nocardia cyriacigeorgica]|nr:hypothetical protein C5B73_05520 [Nocardia cyriacigeorgica]